MADGGAEPPAPTRRNGAAARLTWTVRLGTAFLLAAGIGLGTLQFGLLGAGSKPPRLVVTMMSSCNGPVRPRLDVFTDGRMLLTMSQIEVAWVERSDDGTTTAPDALGDCLLPTARLGEGEIAVPEPRGIDVEESVGKVSRSLRARVAVDASRIRLLEVREDRGDAMLFKATDLVRIEIDLRDRANGFNPAQMDFILRWSVGAQTEGPPEAPIDREGLRIVNRCAGCLVSFGTDVVPTGSDRERRPVLLETGSDYAESARSDPDRNLAFHREPEDGRIAVEHDFALRIDDPSLASREAMISNLLFILIGAAFSLLTEAFLLSPLIRGRNGA